MNKILIVDDDDSIQMLYTYELTEEGYEVITCGSGSQPMALIEKKRPDLIVMEIHLDKINGLDLLQEIRNTYYNLPVILCTTNSIYKYDLRSIAADYYMVKSSDLSELKLSVKMALDNGIQTLSKATYSKVHAIKPLFKEQMQFHWQDSHSMGV